MGCNWGWVAGEQVRSYADGRHPIWHKPPHERSRCETVKESMQGQVGHGMDMNFKKPKKAADKTKGWVGLPALTQRQHQLTPASCGREMTNCFDKDFIEII